MYNLASGDLWENFRKPKNIVVVTTNNQLDSRGNLVMGAGTAKQAKLKVPHIAEYMGEYGDFDYHYVEFIELGLGCLQTKRAWKNNSPEDLVKESIRVLAEHAKINPDWRYNLPRPGCGNGNLEWSDVEPLLRILPSNVWVYNK